MRKKILYGILFLTLLMISTASMVQPVQGYDVGIPDEAIGVELVAEVKIFNEDEWEDSLGKNGKAPDDLYSGDADVVGARQMTIIREIEKDVDDINLLKKVFKTFGGGISPTLDSFDATITSAFAGAMNYVNGSIAGAGGDDTNSSISLGKLAVGISTLDDLLAIYKKEWDGGRMWRDKWYFEKDWETDEDWGTAGKEDLEADDEWDGWGPLFADPRDLSESIDRLGAMQNHFMGELMDMRTQLFKTYMEFFDTSKLHGETPGYVPGVYYGPGLPYNFTSPAMAAVYNDTNTLLNNNAAFKGLLGNFGIPAAAPLNWTLAGGPDLVATGGDWVFTTFMFLEGALAQMYEGSVSMPFNQKLEIFMGIIGVNLMPFQVPIDDYIARMVKEMNFDDDVLYRLLFPNAGVDLDGDGEVSPLDKDAKTLYGAPLGGETIFVSGYADVSAEGNVITIEIEYQDDQADPTDILEGESDPDELDDFEMLVTFSDTGGCGCTWTSGDTILWQAGGVDQIPGYEITILLGASAISVFALVYVIMKKRRK